MCSLSKKSLLMAIHVRLRDDVNIDLKATVFIKSFKGGWLISTQKTSHKLAFTWLSLGMDGVGSYCWRSKKVSWSSLVWSSDSCVIWVLFNFPSEASAWIFFELETESLSDLHGVGIVELSYISEIYNLMVADGSKSSGCKKSKSEWFHC